MKIFSIVYILGKRNKGKRFCTLSYEVIGQIIMAAPPQNRTNDNNQHTNIEVANLTGHHSHMRNYGS